MPEIIITEFMDASSVRSLSEEFEVVYDPDLVDQPGRLESMMPPVRALIVRNRTRVSAGLLASSPKLEVVGRLGVGLDNIDLEACAKQGVEVCPASGANDRAVAEYVIVTAMLLLRQVLLHSSDVLAGKWPRQTGIGREIYGKRLGLVGFGSIARETAGKARALGMSVSAFDPFLPASANTSGVTRVFSLDELASNTDVISLHVPLTDATRNLINSALLKKMRPGAVLINTSRGGVVDEVALTQCLKQGGIAGAALDVFSEEPLMAGHAMHFKGVPNLILTPHIGGVTEESNVRVSQVTAENVRRIMGRQ